jgi:hypothetical protein
LSKLFGALAAFSVAVAIIFYLVMERQERHELKTDQMAATFEREWNEWNADFSHSKRDRDIYQQRAAEADKKLHNIGPRSDAADARRSQDLQEIERAVQDYGRADIPKSASSAGSWILKVAVVLLLVFSGRRAYVWYRGKQAFPRADVDQ